MKVLQIVKTSEGANWAYDQAKCLSDKGIDVVTILPDKKGKTAKKYTNSNLRTIINDFSLPITAPWRFFGKKKELINIIEKEKPDIIHLHFVTNVIFARLALRKDKTPRLFQVPGPLHLENKLTRLVEIAVANNNDYWAPACEYSCNIYKKYVEPQKVFLAYYGGYGGKECKKYSKTGKLRREYNIAKDTILIGMVSYFYKPKYYLGQTRGIKGHEDFIDAIKIINETNINGRVQAVIIGGAWGNSQKYEEKIKKYVRKKGIDNIIFTGFRTDIKDIYKDIDIVVHPSHSENLGGAAESLAAGVPTIATNVGGFRDIVINNETGILCEPRNPNSIALAIKKLLLNKDKAKTMSRNGEKLVRRLLDINNTTEQVISIYVKIKSESQK